MSDVFMTGIMMGLPLALELIGLIFAVAIDSYIGKRRRIIMFIIIAVNFSLIAQNIVHYVLEAQGKYHERLWVSIFGYIMRPVIILLFFYIVREWKKHIFAWALIGINAAVYMSALFSGISFSIDSNNEFHRGPLGYTCHVISVVLLIQLFYISLKDAKPLRRNEVWIPLINVLMIFASLILDTSYFHFNFPISFLVMAVVNSNMFYYIWLHLQFVREHEDELKAEQRIQLMMAQIQPHFLYNTLSTIQALCRTDPAKAFDTTEKFGIYLRQNLDSLNQTDLIPITKEMEHTRVYADIEMIRFPRIHIEYNIQDKDFYLPALTVQPLVENAIRHGVRIRQDGKIYVETQRYGNYHEIVISDNGKGFDASESLDTERSHIGIKNVRERIENMCSGSLMVNSVMGEGTTVIIRIPFGGGTSGRLI